MKQPAVYVLSNKKDGTLYVGVTSNLLKRIYEHKNNITKGFAYKYNCKKLVCFELHETMEAAIAREKQLKSGSRAKKIELIEKLNPSWNDLWEEIL